MPTYAYRSDLGLNKRPVAAADIANAERALGVHLPRDFQDFLVAHDGPTPQPGWFPANVAPHAQWHGPVVKLLSTAGPPVRRLGPRTACMEVTTQASRAEERLPAHYVVIGQLFTQPRMLLLSTAAADHGAVYAWRVGGQRFKPDQLFRVAGSFTEFLGLLAAPPPDVAAAFRRALADTVGATIADADQLPMPHLRCAQALRNIRPYVDVPDLQKQIDDSLGEMERASGLTARLRTLVNQIQDALRAGPGPDTDRVAARGAEWEYAGPEARAWLRGNANTSALAANHFGSTQAALTFVDELYALGAERVLVPETSIQDDDDLGPYADALVVIPPQDARAREALVKRCARELDEPTTLDASATNPVFLWWD